MRAVLIKDGKGPIENLYIGEIPVPILRDGEVLVKVTLLCSDLHFGLYGTNVHFWLTGKSIWPESYGHRAARGDLRAIAGRRVGDPGSRVLWYHSYSRAQRHSLENW